jgi:hypothetical protein
MSMAILTPLQYYILVDRGELAELFTGNKGKISNSEIVVLSARLILDLKCSSPAQAAYSEL